MDESMGRDSSIERKRAFRALDALVVAARNASSGRQITTHILCDDTHEHKHE